MNELKKLELTNTALKQSLANKVADYEGQLASIRAEASLLLEEQGERISQLEQELANANAKLSEFEVKDDEDVAVPSQDA